MTQVETLMQHFRNPNTPSISNLEAQGVYRIRALPRRISDLEERGWRFSRVWKKDPTGQRYVRYVVQHIPA